MQSISVVLPAPLWPMSPTIWPSRSSRSTSSTAVMPPKRLVTPRALEHDGGVVGDRTPRTRRRLLRAGAGVGGGAVVGALRAGDEHRPQDVGAVEQLAGRAR